MIDVVTFGEVMGTVRVTGKIGVSNNVALSIAGSEANVAIGLARLGHSARWAGAVGADGIGDLVVRTLAAEQVDVSHISRDAHFPSGILVSQLSAFGSARVDYHRRQSAGSRVTAMQVRTACTPHPRIVHASGITPAISERAAEATRDAVMWAKEQGLTISFDVNYRSRLWSEDAAREALIPIAGLCDIVIGGPEEIALIAPSGEDWKAQAESLHALKGAEIVVKRGSEGAATLREGQWTHSPAFDVTVVDPIGAGDAFVAGYLSGVLDSLDVDARLRRANALGGCSVATSGDWEGLPSRSEMEAFTGASGDVLR